MTTAQKNSSVFLSLVLLMVMITGCVSPKGDTASQKRNAAQTMRSQALALFYGREPQMRGELEKAPGYGVFSGTSTHTIIVASGQGFGIIRDNSTGKDTYMSALKLGGGLGAGIEDVRVVVVFHDAQTLHNVINNGWGVTGKAAASAKAGTQGDAQSMVVTLPGMSVYRFARNGAMLGGAVEGVKIWKDADLN